jgi:GTP cyclohydrolase I
MNINHLSDVQNKKDTRGLPIQRVGIKELSYPVRFNNLNHSQLSHGTFNLSVHVSADQKGAHLSRFITLLQYYHERDSLVVSLETLPLWHRRMLTQLESEEGFFSCSFKIFLEKKAPISGLSSLMDYQITLSRCGSLLTSYTEIQIHIPVTSLCPCSKEISNYGAHNQRSIIIVSARTSESFNIAHLINLVEQQSSCELFSLLK